MRQQPLSEGAGAAHAALRERCVCVWVEGRSGLFFGGGSLWLTERGAGGRGGRDSFGAEQQECSFCSTDFLWTESTSGQIRLKDLQL